MAITGVTEEEYTAFLENGGELRFELEATDIDSTKGFESSPHIEPYLQSGFELKPSPILENPKSSVSILFYGGSWTRVIAHTYKYGGKIVYSKMGNGKYEAHVEKPAPQDSKDA